MSIKHNYIIQSEALKFYIGKAVKSKNPPHRTKNLQLIYSVVLSSIKMFTGSFYYCGIRDSKASQILKKLSVRFNDI